MGKLIDLSGKKFGRLAVIRRSEELGKQIRWQCICECGAEKNVLGHELRNGGTQSCGCLRNERVAEAVGTHKLSSKRRAEFRIWVGIRDRTNRQSSNVWKYYGGAGVKMCERWGDFAAFFNDMGPRPTANHSIDRVNPFGDYEPNNCRWATAKEQANNRRMHHEVRV